MTSPLVSVIIVNYNSGSRLKKCLDHLDGQTDDAFETIVIDNASDDGSEAAAAANPRASLIEAGANLGFAAANNLAVKKAKGAWVAFLNPDAYASPNWIETFRSATEKYTGASAFGSTQIAANADNRLDGAGDVCHAFGLYYRGGFGAPVAKAPEDGVVFSPCAAAAFYRRDVFNDLGGFDERFFCYGEDVDLGFRLFLSGRHAIQLKNCTVYHEGSGVTGRRSDFSLYHGVRNRLWMFRKNLPDDLYYALAPIHLAINMAMLAMAFLRGEGGAYWRGVRDGVAGLDDMRKNNKLESATRLKTSGEIARRLCWSPVKLVQRAPDLRPLEPLE